ncbi:hypothetical protein KEH51_19775 [[Brevibacterium] frigoritolerans]|uniref:Uncharacterized protein n=1 Tax=Peribacillus frigoritolerans TaxID=450367 RepID=A0A941FK41_9BACI|nr:hypothetical protein [Peribacillus frigoritolerans]
MNDRIIREASQSPRLVIKTNLDAKNVNDENPYTDRINSEGFSDFLRNKTKTSFAASTNGRTS